MVRHRSAWVRLLLDDDDLSGNPFEEDEEFELDEDDEIDDERESEYEEYADLEEEFELPRHAPRRHEWN